MSEIEEKLLDNILDEEIHSEEGDDLYYIAELLKKDRNLLWKFGVFGENPHTLYAFFSASCMVREA